ncbi:MAG: hypothetical protein ACPL88_12925, partial [Bryobacteraceae bacterium]
MSLPEKYELLDLIAENETRTYLARERSTVRMVMVHVLLPGPNRISLLELVLRTRMIPATPGRLQILDLGEHEGNPYVVTEIIPGFTTLRNWLGAELAWASGAQPPAATAPPPSSAPASGTTARRDPSEFTQLFQAVMFNLPSSKATTQPGPPHWPASAEPSEAAPPLSPPVAPPPPAGQPVTAPLEATTAQPLPPP